MPRTLLKRAGRAHTWWKMPEQDGRLSCFTIPVANPEYSANLHGTTIGTDRIIQLTLDLTSLTILTWSINLAGCATQLRAMFVDSPFIVRIAPNSGVNLT